MSQRSGERMDEQRARSGGAIEPKEIRQDRDSAITITFADGHACTFTATALRRECPCAACVNEWTGEQMLDPATVLDDLKISDVTIVGRYALNFLWSDGHSTGIYSFRYLRELCDRLGANALLGG